MINMGRRKFEDVFKDAFQDAELTPSEKVWSKVERDLDRASGDFKAAFLDAEIEPTENVWINVELDLERAAGQKMKRRLLFYKMLAAASVVFAMCVAGVGYYAYNTQSQELIAQRESATESPIAQKSFQDNSLDQSSAENTSSSDSKSPAPGNSAEQNVESTLRGNNESSAQQLAMKDNGAPKTNTASEVQSANGAQPVVTAPNDPGKQNGNSVISRDQSQRERGATVAAGNQLSPNPGSATEPEAARKNDRLKQPGNTATASNNSQQNDNGSVVASDAETKLNPSASAVLPVIASQSDPHKQSKNSSSQGQQKNGVAVTGNDLQAKSNLNPSSSSTPGVAGQKNSFALDNTRKPSPFFVPENAKVPAKPESTADPFMLMMARLDDEAKAMNDKQKTNKKHFKGEQLWTSVGMTAGAYNTVNRSISNDIHSNAIQTATDQVKASGVAYSFGLSVGTKVSERWVVQGGVNYLNQVSDYTSNIIVGGNVVGQFNAINGTNAVALADDAPKFSRNDTEVNWAQTPPFAVSNTMEFISIPVEAGYMVVNKKVGVMVNAGVSTDLFIQNTESANVDGAANPVQTQERGSSDSPFRDLNFIGLLGTEVSYKVGLRYRVALTPGLRYPFNSMYKDDSRIQATPVTFDVGLKFRYIFQ